MSLFRTIALDRLSSPDQLDRLMQVTTPKGWTALAGVGVLLVAVGVWSVVGRIPDTVAGQGILLRTGGVSQLTAPAAGRVVDVAVRAGDVVAAGQVVARVEQPELREEIRRARAELAVLREADREGERFDARDAALRQAVLDRRAAALEREAADAARQIEWLTEQRAARQTLLDRGLITRQQFLDTERDLQAAHQRARQIETEWQQVDVDRLALRNDKRRTARTRRLDLARQERRIADLEDALARRSRIVSRDAGRVLEVTVERGRFVQPGQALMSFQKTGRDVQALEAVLYVSGRDGKRVRPGMEVQIAPATVQPEAHGRMVGTVRAVSDFPATADGMMRLLENETLVQTLLQDGAPYAVHAHLTLDPATPTGYRWTSSTGPPTSIQSGTLATSTITVDHHRPIAWVIGEKR